MEEKLKRYSRLLENEDFVKTIEEIEEDYNLNGSVIPLCNCPNANEYLWAINGMRTLINRLRGLVKETEALLEQDETQGEIDE